MDSRNPTPANDRRPVHQAGCRLQAIDGELLLFNPARETVLYCNQTAAAVWYLCDGHRTVTQIAQLLADTFPETGEEVLADIQEVVQHLVCHQALTLAE